MNEETTSALLGRPLTPTEVTNFSLYLKVAKEQLDQLLCMTLCDPDDPKVYEAREGYSTVFTDIFTDIDEVTIDGDVVTNYRVAQWDKRTGSWYNSLVFDEPFTCSEEVTVSASWGFNTMPSDLKAVLAGLFDLITKKNSFNGTIQSKQVEDFRITFNTDADLDDVFTSKYGKTISKYSLCDVPNVQHGSVCQRWC